MISFLKSFFDYNQRELNRIGNMVTQINDLADTARKLKDADFPKETKKLRAKIKSGTSLDELLPWSYALVREAADRTLGQRHYDVQLIGGVGLHEGKILEQKTGEGKTLTATLALYLNGLTGKGAHLVTVNDYLARSDAGWMGQVFDFLGLTTSAMISGKSYLFDSEYNDSHEQDPRLAQLKPISRKEAYEADITYGINSEFGFDYLRDNMAQHPQNRAQRGFYFAIVDEADSVLIDEARTPHIISAPFEQDVSKYYDYAKIVTQLSEEQDYVIDEKLRTAHLTEKGIEHIESILGVDNIYEKDFETLFHVEAALKANTLFQNDKEYIVRNGEVIIVDEFTGRLLEGRRFSEGLHQAIEAKEGVAIKQESRTLATVSLQNYFRMYDKLAGMTGTAATEAEEFNKIYNTDVLVVPTHRELARKDHADMIYKTMKGKYQAIAHDVAEQYKVGRPVLIGTTSIDKNELLSRILNEKGVKHEVLNAKNHVQEAKIISQAGKKHAVTVATNMAGRGVDIVLGGEVRDSTHWKAEHDEVVELGGLYVIGTERHESRRIDNQLRGRSGRQGDPGETRFYVSLEDDVMRIFGGEQISKMMTMLKFPEDQPLSHGMVSKAIEQAQVKVEGFNFDTRKHLVDYDDVLTRQRDIVYALRRDILTQPETEPKEFEATVFNILNEEIAAMSASFMALGETDEAMIEQFSKDASTLLDIHAADEIGDLTKEADQIKLQEYLTSEALKKYNAQEKKVGQKTWQHVVRSLFLSTIDTFWTQHLTAIDDLRQGINLRGYAQMDPLVEYKNEAFKMFEKLLYDINFEAVRRMMRVQIEEQQPGDDHIHVQDQPMQFQAAGKVNPFKAQPEKQLSQPQQSTAHKKIGRNDPCHCGSGKKYKKCHYPN
jgi:preprotein translocase subunit SecA